MCEMIGSWSKSLEISEKKNVCTQAIQPTLTEIALYLKIFATNRVEEKRSPAEVNTLLKMLTLHLLPLYLVHSRKHGVQYCLLGRLSQQPHSAELVPPVSHQSTEIW